MEELPGFIWDVLMAAKIGVGCRAKIFLNTIGKSGLKLKQTFEKYIKKLMVALPPASCNLQILKTTTMK
jgi:hypothetical protein